MTDHNLKIICFACVVIIYWRSPSPEIRRYTLGFALFITFVEVLNIQKLL